MVHLDKSDGSVAKKVSDLSWIRVNGVLFQSTSRIRSPKIVRVVENPSHRGPGYRGVPFNMSEIHQIPVLWLHVVVNWLHSHEFSVSQQIIVITYESILIWCSLLFIRCWLGTFYRRRITPAWRGQWGQLLSSFSRFSARRCIQHSAKVSSTWRSTSRCCYDTGAYWHSSDR